MASRDSILVSRTFYQIGVITLIASIMWIGVGVYSASTKSSAVDVDKTLLEPLNPAIDQGVIDSLATRLKVMEIIEENVATESATTESATIEVSKEDELIN